MENQEIINELNYKNNIANNKKCNYSNYNFNFNKINPIEIIIVKEIIFPLKNLN